MDYDAAITKLANFQRSIGQSDMDRDLLAIRLGIRTRSWRGYIARGQFTDRHKADIAQALIDIQAWA